MPKVGVYPPRLQQDLADHHGMWHRTPIPDLLAALAWIASAGHVSTGSAGDPSTWRKPGCEPIMAAPRG